MASRSGGRGGRLRAWLQALLGTVAASLLSAGGAAATPDTLDAVLRSRFAGDRTNACVVAAVVERVGTAQVGSYCERPGTVFDATSVVEIGSISKTVAAALVARRIAAKEWALDDPMRKHLPAFEPADPRLQQITVRHLLTHTSGLPALPAAMTGADQRNPYGALTPAAVLASLHSTRLQADPGASAEYSNFGMLVLSAMLSHTAAAPFTRLAQSDVFGPLQMATSGTTANTVQGHAPTGRATTNWTTAPELAGAGFIRSSLNDMVLYARAHLGSAGTEPGLAAALAATRQPLSDGFAMAWKVLRPAGRRVSLHEGTTAGFSSLMAIDEDHRRAVVVLADTSLGDLGGLADVGLRLLGVDVPLGKPRREVAAPEALAAALVGDWDLAGTTLRIRLDGKRLLAVGPVGEPVELRYDTSGSFFSPDLPAVLTARLEGGTVDDIVWQQLGGVVVGQRKAQAAAPALAASAYGVYQLLPGFELRIFKAGDETRLQASGQAAVTARVTASDALSISALGLEIKFRSDADGQIDGLVLTQRGQRLQGKKLQ